MTLQAGTFIKSSTALNGSYFENTIIYITEHNEAGAMGFVISRPFHRSLNELEEFRHVPDIPLYEGGPVDQEHIYFLHMRPDLIENGNRISEGVYQGGDFSQAIEALSAGSLSSQHIKIFVGYCGWDCNELEAELEEGSWELLKTDTADIFQ